MGAPRAHAARRRLRDVHRVGAPPRRAPRRSIRSSSTCPGYVALVAGVHALGRRPARHQDDRRRRRRAGDGRGVRARRGCCSVAARRSSAGLLCALWPARDRGRQRDRHGHAGGGADRDWPSGCWCATAGRRPLGAPALFGLVLGLAAYVRAVALPLRAAGGACIFARAARRWATSSRARSPPASSPSWCCCPGGIRNQPRYGEFFLTDSHGGHTALVGANPNSDGNYSRSLNRLFSEGTGYALFAPPHRRGRSRRVRAGQAVDRSRSRSTRWACWSPRPIGCCRTSGRCSTGRSTAQSVLPPGSRGSTGSRATAPASSGWSTGSGTC